MASKRSQPEDKPLKERSEKKPKVETKPPGHPLPHEPLHLSALGWIGNPTLVSAGGDVDEYGRYVQVSENEPLSAVAWSNEHDAFIYRPLSGQPITFEYRRASYLMEPPADPEYGVAGEADEQDPLLLLHLPGAANAFKAEFTPPMNEDLDGVDFDDPTTATVVGPPFIHWTAEQEVIISPTVPSPDGILSLGMPDLDAHRAALAIDPDQWNYWTGDWGRAFIQQAQTGQPFPPLDKPIVWSSHRHAWGMNVRLVPIRESIQVGETLSIEDNEESDEESDDDNDNDDNDDEELVDALESYRILATVNEVYVTPQFLEEHSQ